VIVGYLAWFVLCFFLYATAFTAAASLVSRQEEVASVTAPISVLLILSFLLV
jgi:ABC-2 type transport system permease protein